MISCAIIEQSDLTTNKRYLASKAVPPNWIVYQATYANSDEFRRVLSCAIENLHRLDDQDPKILIISGHGIPRTGTDIESGDGAQIMFWDYKDYFRVLPPNLVIYLSACFGMYPSSSVLQSDDWNRPYVLGPLVDIKFEHANEFQQELLKIVEASTGAQLNEGLRSLVQRFNDKKSVRDMQYGGREWLFGMFDEDGNFSLLSSRERSWPRRWKVSSSLSSGSLSNARPELLLLRALWRMILVTFNMHLLQNWQA